MENIQNLTLGDHQVFYKFSPLDKLDFFQPTYCRSWSDKFIGFVYPQYLRRFRWVIGSLKLVFLDVMSIFKKNEMNNICFFIQDPKKRTNFGALSVHSRLSSVEGFGKYSVSDLWGLACFF